MQHVYRRAPAVAGSEGVSAQLLQIASRLSLLTLEMSGTILAFEML